MTEPAEHPQGAHPSAREDTHVRGDRQREPADVRKTISRFFVERANADDAKGLAALYEPDAVLALSTGEAARGEQAIWDTFQRLLVGRSVFTAVGHGRRAAAVNRRQVSRDLVRQHNAVGWKLAEVTTRQALPAYSVFVLGSPPLARTELMTENMGTPPDRSREGAVDVHPEDGDARLRELGYEPSLKRGLTIRGNVVLTLSDITPAGSLLVVGLAVISVAGTGSVLAYLAGCALAVTVALCIAELGSRFPLAGGIYSIVARVLGTQAAFLTLLSYIVQAVFLPASIALGVGVYLNALNSSIPVNLSAAVTMVLVTGLAMLKIHANAILTGIFLALEMVVIGAIAGAGFSNPTQPLSVFVDPVGLVDGDLAAFGAGAVIAAVAIAMQSVNGYDAAVAFGEETRGSTRNVGKAVIISALLGIVLELSAFLGAAIGAPDLRGFLASDSPLTYVVAQHWGEAAETVVIVGAIIAFFNACLAITLQFARVLWSSGRDGIWPHGISAALQKVHPTTRAPWVATVLIGVLATTLCFLSNLVAVVTFVSVLTILLYVFIGVAAIVSRRRDPAGYRPFRLPLWPATPLVAIGGALLALSQQATRDLIAVAIIYGLGVAYYVFYLRSRRDAMASLRGATGGRPTG